MVEIIEFPKGELAPRERQRLKEFMAAEIADIEDTACESIDEIRDEIIIFSGYVRRFMDVFDDPMTQVNPDFDFGLYLMEGRIRKIRGMINTLFRASSE